MSAKTNRPLLSTSPRGLFLLKGGSVAVADNSVPSRVEFRRCTFENSTVGEAVENFPQGRGGAISIGTLTTLVVTESVFTRNSCGKKVLTDVAVVLLVVGS